MSHFCYYRRMSRLLRFITREVLEGDLRKAQAESNDSDSGGGARDLRFRPWGGHFEDVVAAMAKRTDETKGRTRYFVDLASVNGGRATEPQQVAFWPPTDARPNEGRLANIDQIPAFVVANMPPPSEGRALYFIWEDEDGAYAQIISEASLRSDDWHPSVAVPILRDLDSAAKTVRGYVDFETGRSGFSHELG